MCTEDTVKADVIRMAATHLESLEKWWEFESDLGTVREMLQVGETVSVRA